MARFAAVALLAAAIGSIDQGGAGSYLGVKSGIEAAAGEDLVLAPGSAASNVSIPSGKNLVSSGGASAISGFQTIGSDATTIGGITRTNLVSRAAAETITGGWTFSTAPTIFSTEISADGGVGRSTNGALVLGADAQSSSVEIGKAGANTKIMGDLEVVGATVQTGAESHEGLLEVFSTTGAGASQALGPEEFRLKTTQAADASNQVRNAGYIGFRHQHWNGSANTTVDAGRFGVTLDDATGTLFSYRFTDLSGTTILRVRQDGQMAASGLINAFGGMTASGLITANAGFTLASGQTATITGGTLAAGSGATVTGTLNGGGTANLGASGSRFNGLFAVSGDFSGGITVAASANPAIAFTGSNKDIGATGARAGTVFAATLDATAATAGAGAWNLSGASSLDVPSGTAFKIGGTAANASFTASNFNSVFGTSTSDASGVHTHETLVHATTGRRPSIKSRYTNSSGATAIETGRVVRLDGNNTISPARADSAANIKGVCGVTDAQIAASATGNIVRDGTPSVEFELSLTLAAGDLVYVSTQAGGKATNVRPGAGNQAWIIGKISDTTGYNGGGSAPQYARVDLDFAPEPITV